MASLAVRHCSSPDLTKPLSETGIRPTAASANDPKHTTVVWFSGNESTALREPMRQTARWSAPQPHRLR